MSNEIEIVEKNALAEINDRFNKLEKIKNNIQEAKRAADDANKRAIAVGKKKVGIKKKPIIEDLQKSHIDIADASIKQADALKKMFEYLVELSKITSELFFLGCENIATNNLVIKQLEAKINDAANDQMDEMVKEEFLNVIKHLKERQDIMQKVEFLQNKVKKQEEDIANIEQRIHLHDEINDELQSSNDFVKKVYEISNQYDEIKKNNDRIITLNEESNTKISSLMKKNKFYFVFSLVLIFIVIGLSVMFAILYLCK